MTMTDSLFLFFFVSFPFFLRYISVEVEEKKKKTSKLKGNENQSIQQRIKNNINTTQNQNQNQNQNKRARTCEPPHSSQGSIHLAFSSPLDMMSKRPPLHSCWHRRCCCYLFVPVPLLLFSVIQRLRSPTEGTDCSAFKNAFMQCPQYIVTRAYTTDQKGTSSSRA